MKIKFSLKSRLSLALAFLCGSIIAAEAQPTILTQPVGLLNGILGSLVPLTVAAQTPTPSGLRYQWRLNGVRIPGATSSSYSIGSLQAINCGVYSVVVNDSVSAVESTAAPVTAILEATASGNDNFASRYELTLLSFGTVRSQNTNATKQAGEPNIIPNNPGGKSIWFKWTAGFNGVATFTSQGSGFDTLLGVYTGNNVSNLTAVPTAINDDDNGGYLTSKVEFNASGGTEYEIVVDGSYGASGDVVLNWSQDILSGNVLPTVTAQPAAQTIVAPGAAVTLTGSWTTVNSANWYLNGQWTGVKGSTYNIPYCDDTNVGAYYVGLQASGNYVNFTQPSIVQINVQQDGTTANNSFASYKFLNSVSTAFVPSAVVQSHRRLSGGDTSGFTTSQVFSTVNAQGEPGEPLVCGQAGGSPVWYTYVTPTNGSLYITTAGSGFNTLLGTFIGPGNSFSTLTNVGCGYTTNYHTQGQPSIYIPNVPAHQTNYIVVDGYNGSNGTVHLNINLGAPVSITAPPQSQAAPPGTNVTFYVSATGSVPMTYQWQSNGIVLPWATNGSVTISNAQASSIGTYSVTVSNIVSSASSSATLSLLLAPVIISQPLSRTVHAGNTANLAISATGSPAPAYQWLFNATSIGANTNILSITNFQASAQGSYSVIVSNAAGVVDSANALLILDSPLRPGLLSMNSNTFGMQWVGSVGSNYIIETSTNLPNWLSVATNITTNGYINFSVTNPPGSPPKFFRAVSH